MFKFLLLRDWQLGLGQKNKLPQHIMVSPAGVIYKYWCEESVAWDGGVVREIFLEEVALELWSYRRKEIPDSGNVRNIEFWITRYIKGNADHFVLLLIRSGVCVCVCVCVASKTALGGRHSDLACTQGKELELHPDSCGSCFKQIGLDYYFQKAAVRM